MSHAVAQLDEALRYKPLQTGRSLDRFPMVLLESFIDMIVPAALLTVSNRNEYQE
jgi:hypothetical protein